MEGQLFKVIHLQLPRVLYLSASPGTILIMEQLIQTHTHCINIQANQIQSLYLQFLLLSILTYLIHHANSQAVK